MLYSKYVQQAGKYSVTYCTHISITSFVPFLLIAWLGGILTKYHLDMTPISSIFLSVLVRHHTTILLNNKFSNVFSFWPINICSEYQIIETWRIQMEQVSENVLLFTKIAFSSFSGPEDRRGFFDHWFLGFLFLAFQEPAGLILS